jgi:hypothetical protein
MPRTTGHSASRDGSHERAVVRVRASRKELSLWKFDREAANARTLIRIRMRCGSPNAMYAMFDALIVASALRANCGVLWSEDMQDGIVIDRRLRIANPFRAA